jgi:hypothetical protein
MERHRGRRFLMGEAPPGLYLKPPHGELSFTGAKKALAKAREFGIGGREFTLCSGRYAWGEMALGRPEVVGVDEFDARFAEHRVSVKERERWWPGEERLYLYAYEKWQPYDRPRRVEVPASVQTLMGPLEFVEEGKDMGTTININTGAPATMPEAVSDDAALAQAMTGNPEAIAQLGGKARGEGQGVGGGRQGDGGADKCVCPECGKELAHEKGTPCADMECPDCGVAMVGKDEDGDEEEKIWKPSDAEGHTSKADTPAKQRQWASAANSHRKGCLGKIEGTPTKEQIDECEAQAVLAANAAVKNNPAKEKEMDPEQFTDHRTKQGPGGELSLGDIQSEMWDLLAPPRSVEAMPEDREYPRDIDVYDDYVTYKLAGKYYMRSYSVADGEIQLGEPVEVEWIMRPKALKGLPEDYKAELVQEFDALELGDKSLSDDEKAALTSAQRRALPEKSFAWVETGEGCEKDEDGKRPLKCLHLPYKKADGKTLDCARVRNARGRIPQMSGVPQAAKDKIAAAQKKCTAQTETGGKALEPLKEQATKVFEAAAGLWAAITGGSEPEPSFLQGDTGLKVFEADGETWLLTWTTNAFEDRDGEIFSTASIEDYAERAWKEIQETGSKGQYDFWHAPGSEFADIKWVGAVGRFLVEMGTFHDSEVGQAFKTFFTECEEAQEAIAPDGWGASHRYKYRPWDRADGVYEWFDKDRTSVLAIGRAANPYTSMEVLTMLNDEQKEKLNEVGDALKKGGLDIDLVSVVETIGADATKKLEDANVAHKGKEAKDGKKGSETEAAPAGGAPDETMEAIAKRVADMMGLEQLSKALGELVGMVQKHESRLEDVEKGDQEREKERKAWEPQYMWLRPSQDKGTIIDDTEADKDLKDKQPEVPTAIKGFTEWRTGQPQPPAGGSA